MAVEASEDEWAVLMPAPNDLEGATKLMLEIDIWRARTERSRIRSIRSGRG